MEADELWDYVVSSTAREASKAIDIRSAITAKLGKRKASELLSKTNMCVSRGCQGKKFCILKAGGVILKLK